MPKGKGIGGHTKPNNGRHELWLTPLQVLHFLGRFDLDLCACPEPRPWTTADKMIALPQDGLAEPWSGRVWLNPPYGDKIDVWMERMSQHRNGISLIFARTDTETWIRWVWPFADSILFISGRLYFHYPDGTKAEGNAGGPSALIAYTPNDTDHLFNSGIAGALVRKIR
jgi:hypothetical protein